MGQEILIVDDSSSIRQSMKYLIVQSGYSVIEAGNGKEALSVVTNNTKLIITDINMPEMDGIEFIKLIRSGTVPNIKTIPIVILTTESQPEMKQQGKDAGATAWIVKPFAPEDIISVIKKLIG